MNRQQLAYLENEYHQKMRTYKMAEERLDEYHDQFNKRTKELIHDVYRLYQGNSFQELTHYLHQLETNLLEYNGIYHKQRQMIEEARFHEKQSFQQRIEERGQKI